MERKVCQDFQNSGTLPYTSGGNRPLGQPGLLSPPALRLDSGGTGPFGTEASQHVKPWPESYLSAFHRLMREIEALGTSPHFSVSEQNR